LLDKLIVGKNKRIIAAALTFIFINKPFFQSEAEETPAHRVMAPPQKGHSNTCLL